MRSNFLTPHQLDPYVPYIDTVLVSSFSPQPLDVAVPADAAAWICEQLSNRLISRFAGRMSIYRRGGSWCLPTDDIAKWETECVLNHWIHPVRYAVILTDRRLASELVRLEAPVAGLMFDWFLWVRRRVSSTRLADAWMYLAHACPEYWNSPERRNLGIDNATSMSMAEEGRKLFVALEGALAAELERLWGSIDPCPAG